MVSWCHDTVVSPVQCFDDEIQQALLLLFLVFLNDEVDPNSGNFVLAGLDVSLLVDVNDLGKSLFFLEGKTVSGSLFPKFLDCFSNRLNRGVMVS